MPGKILKEFQPGKTMLRVVIDAVDNSAFYINRKTDRIGIRASYAVLLPTGDPAIREARVRASVIEGPEQDVLARYHLLAERFDPDFIVRITADCPFVPAKLMTDVIMVATHRQNQYDYCANVYEPVRTAMDGHDIEVISRKALNWAHENASDPYDREHVTPIFRSSKRPEWMKVGCVMHPIDLSSLKMSVDTPEEFQAQSDAKRKYLEKIKLADQMFGRAHVHIV